MLNLLFCPEGPWWGRPAWPRRCGVVAVVLGVLLGHLGLGLQWPWRARAWGLGSERSAAVATVVRLEAPTAPRGALPAGDGLSSAPPRAPEKPAAAEALAHVAAKSSAEATAEAATAAEPRATAAAAQAGEVSPPALPGPAVPWQPTRLPPSVQRQWHQLQGGREGTVDWGWAAPDGAAGAYRAWWRSTATGGARLVAGHTASSTGHRDAWGVAPVRHLSGSGQRSPQAVNFMRDRREIRFSGPATVWPWADGVQDRLSVLWQWQALLWARPEGAEGAKGGAPLPVWVAGPRGDLQLWVLQWVGTVQAHDDQGRPLRAQHWRRQATARHDLQFDVGFSDGPEPEPLWLRWAQEGPTSVPLWAWDPQRWPADWVRAQNTTMSGAPLR